MKGCGLHPSLLVLSSCDVINPALAPRRTAGAWAGDATRDDLLLAFRWELAQALKQPLIECGGNYNQQRKVTFLRDYSEKIPLALLRMAAIDAFTPPAQRECVAVARVLRRLPPELAAHVPFTCSASL